MAFANEPYQQANPGMKQSSPTVSNTRNEPGRASDRGNGVQHAAQSFASRQILQLQSLAGNRAVHNLLAGMAKPEIEQQKQGRAQATLQLKSLSINDDAALEREADRMGVKANQAGATPQARDEASVLPPKSSSSAASSSAAPIQGVFILRNGQPVWEDDPYVLQPGESYYLHPDLQQHPSVTVDSGMHSVVFDHKGDKKTLKRKAEDAPPTHKELQKTRENQGTKYRQMLKKNPKSLPDTIKRLRNTAEGLEKVTGDLLPKNHAKKVKTKHESGPISGKEFRAIEKGLDEYTQSEATSSFHKGALKRSNTPPDLRKLIDEAVGESLRIQSADRARTQTIVGPVDFQGATTGQQHPTSRDQPKLPGGSSGHAYADRERVHAQNQVFDDLSQIPDAPPEAVFLGSTLAANVYTLSHMSLPGSANNLPSFNSARAETQRQERETIKDQTNLLAQELHMPTATGTQHFDAPYAAHETPASPRRMDEADTLIEKNKPKFTQQETEEYQNWHDVLTEVLQELGQAVSHTAPAQSIQQLGQLHNALQQINRNDPSQRNQVIHLYQQAYNWLYQMHQQVNRRTVGQNSTANNSLGARGRRYPALMQFFSECGQMAASNILIAASQWNYNAAQAVLNLTGAPHNNIGENHIRDILAHFNRPDIPVIGSMQQMNNVVNYVQTNNQQALAQFNIEATEQQGAAGINAFLSGQRNVLHAIVNTTGHLDDSQRGHHWIAVMFIRSQDGQIQIHYQDSLDFDADYTQLFAAYRQFLGHVPPNNGQTG